MVITIVTVMIIMSLSVNMWIANVCVWIAGYCEAGGTVLSAGQSEDRLSLLSTIGQPSEGMQLSAIASWLPSYAPRCDPTTMPRCCP